MIKYNKQQIKNLIIGSAGILSMFLINSFYQEHLISFPYRNITNDKQQVYPVKLALVFIPAFVTWILGSIFNKIFIIQTTIIPERKSLKAGFCAFTSTVTYTIAIMKTSFPLIMAIKSCSILSVLVIAAFCSRVREHTLILGPKKIIVGGIVTIGVIFFKFFDPQSVHRQKSSQAIGIILIIVSLIADGFLPDVQAVIKSQYKPQPTQMMVAINKWVAILCFIGLVVMMDLVKSFTFMIDHPEIISHLIIFALTAFIGQLFVYRMIKQFKQHIVPFVITVRKVLTVIISIIFYHHATSNLQLLGMFIIFGATFFQFASEVKKKEQKIDQTEKIQLENDIKDNIESGQVITQLEQKS